MRYFMQVSAKGSITTFPMGTSVVDDDLAAQAAEDYLHKNEGVEIVQILRSIGTISKRTVYDRNLETSGKN